MIIYSVILGNDLFGPIVKYAMFYVYIYRSHFLHILLSINIYIYSNYVYGAVNCSTQRCYTTISELLTG